MDERLHLVGSGVIDSFGQITEEDIPVVIVFSGITLNLRVPKNFVFDQKGVRMFQVDEPVYVDCLVSEHSSIKSYESQSGSRNTYVQASLKVKRVLAFQKVKG